MRDEAGHTFHVQGCLSCGLGLVQVVNMKLLCRQSGLELPWNYGQTQSGLRLNKSVAPLPLMALGSNLEAETQ